MVWLTRKMRKFSAFRASGILALWRRSRLETSERVNASSHAALLQGSVLGLLFMCRAWRFQALACKIRAITLRTGVGEIF